MTTNQVSLTTTAAQILPANAARYVAFITATADCYVGVSGVTATTGFLAKAGITYPIESPAAVYGITASGTSTATYLDQTAAGFPVANPN